MDIPGIFTLGYTRISKRLREIDGIPLKEGDALLDVKGVRWFFIDERLQDRLAVSLLSQEYDIKGGMITPRPSTPTLTDYVPDAPYEVTLVDVAGKRGASYPCRSFPLEAESWGWRMEEVGSIASAKFICMDPDGVVKMGYGEDTCASGGGTWDRPCVTDTDCPYYDPRRARGGCSRSGFCKFPLGAKVLSYRTATADNLLLRGCSPNDPSYPWCSDQPAINARFAVDEEP
jgi:hypothetical protein